MLLVEKFRFFVLVFCMRDIVKVWIISGVMSVAPLSASDSSLSNQNNIKEKITSEIGSVINNFDIVGVNGK